MAYSLEFLADFKTSVKAKLRELGAFVDEELPDYIMVMVANKKKRESMNSDLQLFLGNKTELFTEWLHCLLESSVKSEAKKKRNLSQKTSRSDKKDKQTKRVSRSLRPDRAHSRSRSPVQRKVSNRVSPETSFTLEQPDTDFISVRADENDFSDETVCPSIHAEISTLNEQRRVVSTSSLPGKGNSVPEDSPPTIRSVIKPPQKPNNQVTTSQTRPSGMLLKRAVNEAEASIEKPSSVAHKITTETPPIASVLATSTRPSAIVSGRKRLAKPTQSSINEDDDAPPLKSTKFVVTLNEITAPVKSNVKSRLGPRLVHVSSNNNNNIADNGDIDSGRCERVDAREILLAKKRQRGQQLQKPVAKCLSSLPNPSPPMVVSLSESLEEDDTFLDEDLSKNPGNMEKEVGGERKSSDPAPKRENIPSTLQRCKYWPVCRNGPSCQFLHPTQECKAFPNCRYGERCLCVHPPCRYGADCARPNCVYSHTRKLTSPTTGVSGGLQPAVVCRFFPNCKNSACSFFHPEAVACRFGPGCMHRSTTCKFSHPPLASSNTAATLEKPTIPATHRLKWVKPQSVTTTVSSTADKLTSPVGVAVPTMTSTTEVII